MSQNVYILVKVSAEWLHVEAVFDNAYDAFEQMKKDPSAYYVQRKSIVSKSSDAKDIVLGDGEDIWEVDRDGFIVSCNDPLRTVWSVYNVEGAYDEINISEYEEFVRVRGQIEDLESRYTLKSQNKEEYDNYVTNFVTVNKL